MQATEARTTDWLRLIQAEYLEIPGLHLTKPQIQRLFGLDPLMCESLVNTLVDVKFLRLSRGEGYVRADR